MKKRSKFRLCRARGRTQQCSYELIYSCKTQETYYEKAALTFNEMPIILFPRIRLWRLSLLVLAVLHFLKFLRNHVEPL